MTAAFSLSNDSRTTAGVLLQAGRPTSSAPVCPSAESRSSPARCKRLGHEALWFHQLTDG